MRRLPLLALLGATLLKILWAFNSAGSVDAVLFFNFARGIEEVAASLNPAVGITGILCYGSGQFLQALGGEREPLNTLYHHIETDPRHTNCSLMLVEDIATGDFGE